MSGSGQKVTEIKKKKNIRERKLLYQISTYLVHKKKRQLYIKMSTGNMRAFQLAEGFCHILILAQTVESDHCLRRWLKPEAREGEQTDTFKGGD